MKLGRGITLNLSGHHASCEKPSGYEMARASLTHILTRHNNATFAAQALVAQ